MFGFIKNIIKQKSGVIEKENAIKNVSKSLDENEKAIKEIFEGDMSIIYRSFTSKNGLLKCLIIYVVSMVDKKIIDKDIIMPITINADLKVDQNLIDILANEIITTSEAKKTQDMDEIVGSILTGDTILFVDGMDSALRLNTNSLNTRAIEEPETEKLVRGPKEGFNESLVINLSLIRKRLKTSDFKLEFMTLGKKTNTKVCIGYIKSIVNPKILAEVKNRLNKIDIDGVLDTGYIEEFIRDHPLSPFKTVGSTERPDVVVAELLEGRITILCDGTPFALTVPYVFVENMQSSEDYYTGYIYASFNRFLRYLGFFLTTSTPAIYLSLVTFHQEMVPTPLILSIAAARQNVPFPTVVEIFLMMLIFEVLREAGTRIPTPIGQAVSIVGALVLGESAVVAKFVSAPMVIITAITGIAVFLIPKVGEAALVYRFFFLALSTFLGLYGYMFGVIIMCLNLSYIKSFGVPYLLSFNAAKLEDIKDTAIRLPWWYMDLRPKAITSRRKRQN